MLVACVHKFREAETEQIYVDIPKFARETYPGTSISKLRTLELSPSIVLRFLGKDLLLDL